MVALSNDYQQATDWGTSAYVRDVLKRETLCRTLYLDKSGALEAVSRTYTAPDCQPAEELVLHDFSDLADALAFYEQFNFRPVSKSKKRIVLQVNVRVESGVPSDTLSNRTKRDWRAEEMRRKANREAASRGGKQRAAKRRDITPDCKIEGCTEPREPNTGRRLCTTHRREADAANKRKNYAKKRGVVQS